MSLYSVKFQRKASYSDTWSPKMSYAIGNTPNEAIDFVKKKFRTNINDMKDFNATIISSFDDDGDFKLYRVTYEDWNMTFSGTNKKEILVVGRCKTEAAFYAMAYVSPDAMEFDATEISEIAGHKIIVE